MTTFLTWSLDNGKAGYGDIMITIDGKPDLPWPFDSLYYEPQTGMVCKVVNGRQVQLSEAEKEQCAACARRLVESADFYVSAKLVFRQSQTASSLDEAVFIFSQSSRIGSPKIRL